ncbi:MAG: hypothetical protein ACRYFX_14590 [Janthinobacterium lividum]
MQVSRFLLACLPAAALLGSCARQPGTTAAADTTAAATTPAPAASKAGAGKSPSRFLATPPTIDGKADDWADSLQYDASNKLQYQVLNDTRMVYVRLKAADATAQAKLTFLGLVVWLDSTGRNQQQFGVHFPMGVDLATLKAPAERPSGAMGPSAAERQADHVARLHQVLDNAKEMELLRYKGNKEPTLTDTQSQLGVKAAATIDAQDNLIYELAVPLRLLFRHAPALAKGQPATVGVWLAGQRPPTPKGGDSQYDASNNGMGGYGGGMGGRGGYRPGSGMRGASMQSTISTVSLKTSLQLVGK